VSALLRGLWISELHFVYLADRSRIHNREFFPWSAFSSQSCRLNMITIVVICPQSAAGWEGLF
jgi:hypothetical protein